MTYNGWPNYETWCAFSWITNEFNTYYELTDFIDTYSYKSPEELQIMLTNHIKFRYEDYLNPLDNEANLYSDLLNSALKEIDWYKIAENLIGKNKEKINV